MDLVQHQRRYPCPIGRPKRPVGASLTAVLAACVPSRHRSGAADEIRYFHTATGERTVAPHGCVRRPPTTCNPLPGTVPLATEVRPGDPLFGSGSWPVAATALSGGGGEGRLGRDVRGRAGDDGRPGHYIVASSIHWRNAPGAPSNCRSEGNPSPGTRPSRRRPPAAAGRHRAARWAQPHPLGSRGQHDLRQRAMGDRPLRLERISERFEAHRLVPPGHRSMTTGLER